jgi:hypothetical protein
VAHGVQNAAFQGKVGEGGHVMFGMEAAVTNVTERDIYSYFYGTVVRMTYHNTPLMGHYLTLYVDVDYIVVGYDEHVHIVHSAPQFLELFEGVGPLPINAPPFIRLFYYFDDGGPDALEGIMAGERYLFRGAHYWVSRYGRGIKSMPPFPGSPFDFLYMYPLNDYGLWYVHVPEGHVDFAAPGLENLAADIALQQYNHSTLWLRTTADMTAMPSFQEQINRAVLREGRLLTHEDYLRRPPCGRHPRNFCPKPRH